MTKLPAVGRVDNIDDVDLDPIEVPVVGYTIEKEEIEEVFRFRPVQPAGATLDILLYVSVDGSTPVAKVMHFLEECVLAEDRERWRDFLNDPAIMIEQSVLAQLYRALMEVYAARPTMPSSALSGGGKPGGRTSRAASAAKASGGGKKKTPSSS